MESTKVHFYFKFVPPPGNPKGKFETWNKVNNDR